MTTLRYVGTDEPLSTEQGQYIREKAVFARADASPSSTSSPSPQLSDDPEDPRSEDYSASTRTTHQPSTPTAPTTSKSNTYNEQQFREDESQAPQTRAP